jgi:hypothetical protein
MQESENSCKTCKWGRYFESDIRNIWVCFEGERHDEPVVLKDPLDTQTICMCWEAK